MRAPATTPVKPLVSRPLRAEPYYILRKLLLRVVIALRVFEGI